MSLRFAGLTLAVSVLASACSSTGPRPVPAAGARASASAGTPPSSIARGDATALPPPPLTTGSTPVNEAPGPPQAFPKLSENEVRERFGRELSELKRCRVKGARFDADPLLVCPMDRFYSLLGGYENVLGSAAESAFAGHLEGQPSLKQNQAARHKLLWLAAAPEAQLIARERMYRAANLTQAILAKRQGLDAKSTLARSIMRFYDAEDIARKAFGQRVSDLSTTAFKAAFRSRGYEGDPDAFPLERMVSNFIQDMRAPPPGKMAAALPDDAWYWREWSRWFPAPVERLRKHRKERSYLVANQMYAAGSRYVRWLEQSPSLDRVVNELPEGASYLEYARYSVWDWSKDRATSEAHYLAFLVRRTGGTSVVEYADLGPAAAIDELIESWRSAIAARASYESIAQTLHAALLGAFPAALGGTHLVIAPVGELTLLPFEALMPKAGTFVDDLVTVHYGDIRDLVGDDLLRTYARRLPRPQSGLILTDPDFEASAGSAGTRGLTLQAAPGSSPRPVEPAARWPVRWQMLPGTRAEGEAVARLVGKQGKLFAGSSATEAVIRRHPRPKFLHLATHGFFVPSLATRQQVSAVARPGEWMNDYQLNLLYSDPSLTTGVVLAGANQLADGIAVEDYADDGIMTAFEVERLNLVGTELVVLSACDTGVGLSGDSPRRRTARDLGSDIWSLRRAFRAAGAASVVASLWPVADAETAWLMEAFYRAFLAGKHAASAMRAARLELRQRLRDEGRGREHPYLWAAFTVEGGGFQPLPRR